MRKGSQNLIVLAEVDSTNNYANRLLATEAPEHGTVVLSHFQRLGRGQRENLWESAPGMNLLASIILFPAFLPPGEQFCLSKITCLAILEWLQQETGFVTVKWPNDVYAGKRKIAGILIEASLQGNRFHSAVVGMGLNLNQETFSSEIPNPVSLKQLTGKIYAVQNVAEEIHEIFMKWYRMLEEGFLNEIDAAYHANLFRINEWSLFRQEGQIFEARITGTGEYGKLVLEDRQNKRTSYSFKEIEFVI
jgi:BirA family transcriptional regulator, biotin operon repressor / biotin---[acetyl-CoA-carboxylase] ligase